MFDIERMIVTTFELMNELLSQILKILKYDSRNTLLLI